MAKQEWLVKRTITLERYFVVLADSQEDAKETACDGGINDLHLKADRISTRKLATRGLSEAECRELRDFS